MTNAANTTKTAKCLRCGRTLRSAASIAAGVGPTCRTRIAATAKTVDAKPAQVAKAVELIELGAIAPVHHGRAYRVVATSGDTTYLTSREGCTCPAGLRERMCYHRVAAELLAAAVTARTVAPVVAAPVALHNPNQGDPFAAFDTAA